MSEIISGGGISDIYCNLLSLCIEKGVQNESRVGTVLTPGSVILELQGAKDQLLLMPKRKFNPFFAVIEAIWVLSGSNKLAPLQNVLKNYVDYSDDGETLNGAYGYRLREFFGFDQINSAIKLLSADPSTRRCVLTMYEPSDLNNPASKDLPCNTSIYVKINSGLLDVTILNRSSDAFLGVPYNAFVFNCLQRLLARSLDIGLGVQRHYIDNLHLYDNNLVAANAIIIGNTPEATDSSSVLADYSASAEMYDFIFGTCRKFPDLDSMQGFNAWGDRFLRVLSGVCASGVVYAGGEHVSDAFWYSVKLWVDSCGR